jgi:dipeptidyl aminopeptidase/acylaminoacyl peptidase
MTIFRVLYSSGPYQVSGYLGIPGGISPGFRAALTQWAHTHHVSLSLRQSEVPDAGEYPSPQGNDVSGWPGFLYCRGGIGRVGMVKLDWVREFTDQGYVVFAPCYRGADRGEGRDEFGGTDVEDSNAAYQLLQSMPWVIHDRISIMGFSRGSINATATAIQSPDVRKLILWGGVSDLAKTYEQRVDLRRMLKRVVGGTPTREPDEYRQRSPITMVRDIPCPCLIVHGTDDVQVDISHAIDMYHAMLQNKSDVTLHCYHGYGHHLPPLVHQAVVERMFDWLNG